MHRLSREDAEALYMIWDRNGRNRIDQFLDALAQLSRDEKDEDWENALEDFLAG